VTLEELDRFFEDPLNRRWGVFYYCPSDPRVIAPSHPTWRGYQINFANPKALPVLFLYISLLILPASLALVYGPEELGSLIIVVVLVFSLSIAFLIVLSANLSRRHTTS